MASLEQDLLKEILSYDKESGIFKWKENRGNVKANSVAGRTDKNGYIVIKINSKQYMAHRLAWLYEYGYEPKEQIDHINHIRNDNRIYNIREVSISDNMKNQKLRKTNKSGVVGVSYNTIAGKWNAKISNKSLGYYDNFEDAVKARKKAEAEANYHKNHGKELKCLAV